MLRKVMQSYFVVMTDLGGRLGCEACVNPEETRAAIAARIARGDYFGDIVFVHHVADGLVEDITSDIMDEAEVIAREYA